MPGDAAGSRQRVQMNVISSTKKVYIFYLARLSVIGITRDAFKLSTENLVGLWATAAERIFFFSGGGKGATGIHPGSVLHGTPFATQK